ncbi:hypothetical protein [Corynebacterium tuscaniense]|uniref:hypothetical protein n=1 Tax=Corynebacterium tuscaniense TaxID=302449 RepID=UPI00050F5253|nr:hypothetical protein [Corynebacterium tuscaniense]KGF22832.1 hypothetical protein HMPREF2129_06680 [Corynebacterium tuscaniense DNF00037]
MDGPTLDSDLLDDNSAVAPDDVDSTGIIDDAAEDYETYIVYEDDDEDTADWETEDPEEYDTSVDNSTAYTHEENPGFFTSLARLFGVSKDHR